MGFSQFGKRLYKAANIFFRSQGRERSNGAHLRTGFEVGGPVGWQTIEAGRINAVGYICHDLWPKFPSVAGDFDQILGWDQKRRTPQRKPTCEHAVGLLPIGFIQPKSILKVNMRSSAE